MFNFLKYVYKTLNWHRAIRITLDNEKERNIHYDIKKKTPFITLLKYLFRNTFAIIEYRQSTRLTRSKNLKLEPNYAHKPTWQYAFHNPARLTGKYTG